MGKTIMLILGIESSCDETSVAIVEDGSKIIVNLILSQMDLHRDFGGVVPELACRRHLEMINPLLETAISKAGIGWKDIDAVAVTSGPGLVGAVLIGVAAAKALAYSLNKPLIGVNHLEGHIYANLLAEGAIPYPAMVLLVSGGHTSLILAKGHGDYQLIGQTKDDAAGEAYDKIARMLNLGFPGGPVVDKAAQKGDRNAISFPRAMMENKSNFDFSFSGLKTAVIYYLRSDKGKNAKIEDISACFQEAVVDVLVTKTIRAAKKFNTPHILMGGGVACNSRLREEMEIRGNKEGIKVHVPSPVLCTDNAAMIASAGYYMYRQGKVSDMSLDAVPIMKIG